MYYCDNPSMAFKKVVASVVHTSFSSFCENIDSKISAASVVCAKHQDFYSSKLKGHLRWYHGTQDQANLRLLQPV